MVLIVTKVVGRRADIIFVPKISLNTFLDVHVDRKSIWHQMKTCIVSPADNWTGKLPHPLIVKLLVEVLNRQRTLVGETRYSIPNHWYLHLKCREFTDTQPYSEPADGQVVLTVIPLNPQAPGGVIGALDAYEKISSGEKMKVSKTILKYKKLMDNKRLESMRLLLVKHIHCSVQR